MFETLVHADWSVSPRKRQTAKAERRTRGWTVGGPARVGPSADFLKRAFAGPSVLLGFDFPIGLPSAYGERTGFPSFREALPALGSGDWSRFFDPAETPDEISLHRPFYPGRNPKGSRRTDLVQGLGLSHFDQILRRCEMAGAGGRNACALFWVLGGNQVGRGALAGWREIVVPALAKGARLWPFEGPLEELAKAPGPVIAETYPALSYRMVGAGFARGESKRNRMHRQTKAPALLAWAETHNVTLESSTVAAIRDGFGSSPTGEDAFDALLGLFKMIEIADGRRPAASADYEVSDWEGWILGR